MKNFIVVRRGFTRVGYTVHKDEDAARRRLDRTLAYAMSREDNIPNFTYYEAALSSEEPADCPRLKIPPRFRS